MHKRQAIRDEAATLATGLTTTGSNIYKTRLFPLEQSNLPAWVVELGDEDIELEGMGRQEVRALELVFTGIARSTSGEALADTLDTMLEELEAVMLPANFSNLDDLVLDTVESESDVEETDAAVGRYAVTYVARYFTIQGAPSA